MLPSSNKSVGSKKIIKSSDAPLEDSESRSLAENLYKKNIELLTKNKTLSLLSKLYGISILTLKPQDLAVRISQTVQNDLSFELVSIFIFESESDSLIPLAISTSERVNNTLKKLNFSFENLKIPRSSTRNFFKNVISAQVENRTNNLEEVWGDLVDPTQLQTIISEDHIMTTLLYPLIVESEIFGTIMIALNRSYESLSPFEEESLNSIKNVVALALEKAYLYQKLEDANAQLQELDRQKDELLGIVSHQLATPISALKWDFEMLLDGDIGEVKAEQKDFFQKLQGVTAQLSDLVSMILDVSRIQLGRMKVDRTELDLNIFFGEVVDIMQAKARERKIHLTSSVPEKMGKGNLDKRLMLMITENLLSNAIKYTPEGGKVKFDAKVENGILRFSVSDTGCGIPEQDQDKIFGKLFRASNVRSVDGNGFGLYVVKGAAEGQGGTISFKSTEGKGTEFFVELPLNVAEKAA